MQFFLEFETFWGHRDRDSPSCENIRFPNENEQFLKVMSSKCPNGIS
jgi:hypothetical protein